MLVGKRTGHPMKRTKSMTVDVQVLSNNVENSNSVVSYDPQNHPLNEFPEANLGYDQGLSPRNPGGGTSAFSITTDHVLHATAPFLRSCCLCKRRLAPGRDIYMYRGDTAFCSLECREQQMKRDQRKEKSNFLASKKGDRHSYA